MATERAVADPYLDDLIARYAPEARVIKLPAQGLVSFVEHRYLGSSAEERRRAVEPYVRRLIQEGADRIVLACTHFLHVQEDIAACAEALGAHELKIVDSLQGVREGWNSCWAGDGQGLSDRRARPAGTFPPDRRAAVRSPLRCLGRALRLCLRNSFDDGTHDSSPEKVAGESEGAFSSNNLAMALCEDGWSGFVRSRQADQVAQRQLQQPRGGG
jgi:hypothetical protein